MRSSRVVALITEQARGMVRGQTFSPRETGYLTASSRDVLLVKNVRQGWSDLPVAFAVQHPVELPLSYNLGHLFSNPIIYKDAARKSLLRREVRLPLQGASQSGLGV